MILIAASAPFGSAYYSPPIARGAANGIEAFTQVSADFDFACAIRTGGTAVCWGSDIATQAEAPSGTFTEVSAGGLEDLSFACGVRTTHKLVCWGTDENKEAEPPAGQFTVVSVGDSFACAIRSGGDLVCWGQIPRPPSGQFSDLSAGQGYACAIRISGTLTCWGNVPAGGAPKGEFKEVSSGDGFACGIRIGVPEAMGTHVVFCSAAASAAGVTGRCAWRSELSVKRYCPRVNNAPYLSRSLT